MESVCDKLKNGAVEIISDSEFSFLLSSKKELVIKIGFDPTSKNLHLGHLVILKKLLDFQNAGYFIHLVVGDFTASIGDPSGKNTARQSILNSEIKKNYFNYDAYFFKFLDSSRLILYFNSTWFNFMLLSDFVQLLSVTTISRLLERSDFKLRYLNNLPIGIHELIYPLLQSYDSVFLFSDIEIGGIDQKFNLLLARDMQKKFFQKPQVLLMMPILIGLDGKNKMSKSLNNYVALDTDSYELFCKIMSIPDSLLKEYYVIFNFLSPDDFDVLFIDKAVHPMDLKLELAVKIVSMLYDTCVADDVKCKFINRVTQNNFDDLKISEFFIPTENILLSDLLLMLKFVDSLTQFKYFIKSSAISIDDIIVTDRHLTLVIGKVYFFRVGKQKVAKIFLKKSKKQLDDT
ncbi:MAG: tyrosine--tRNA ligase [Candidatus Riesia sp.]|nr:tyrosine--tRNA ligase [Candidatus Riesia sp.]